MEQAVDRVDDNREDGNWQKKCAKQSERVALALRAESATVRQAAWQAARPREGHAVGKPLLYFALTQQRPRLEQLELQICAERPAREGV